MKVTFHSIWVSIFLSILIVLGVSCKRTHQASQSDSHITDIVFLQINDVYEIAPLENGKVGGMARVAQIKKELLAQNPNTYSFLAGDFLSPSLIGTIKVDGERLAGKQMVDIMNKVGIDYVCFGNHEFDIKEYQLLNRINESEFTWIAGNVKHKVDGKLIPFEQERGGKSTPLNEYEIISLKGANGQEVKIGLLSVCLPFNKTSFVHYEDVIEHAKKTYATLSAQTDFVIGLTHQFMGEDEDLARAIPQLPLIMGGHDHHHMISKVGKTTITKADANAKSAYVHKISFNHKTQKVSVSSELVKVDEGVAFEPQVKASVDQWNQKVEDIFTAKGISLTEVIYTTKEPLDGRESSIRKGPTNLGKMITQAMYNAKKGADAAILNSGSIRIDDQLSGNITQLDVLRVLPFGGPTYNVNMKGSLLKQTLEVGLGENKGIGGYLQVYKIEQKAEGFYIDGSPLNEDEVYNIAIGSFLMSGRESNLDFLNEKNPAVVSIDKPKEDDLTDSRRDIQHVLIQFMKQQ